MIGPMRRDAGRRAPFTVDVAWDVRVFTSVGFGSVLGSFARLSQFCPTKNEVNPYVGTTSRPVTHASSAPFRDATAAEVNSFLGDTIAPAGRGRSRASRTIGLR